jgi:hypothetical protein
MTKLYIDTCGKAGELHSVQDARGVVRKVKREFEKEFASNIDLEDDFS